MPFLPVGNENKKKKFACEPCIRGHRSSKCQHQDRVLVEVRKPGRPLSSCPHPNGRCSCDRVRLALPRVSSCACGPTASNENGPLSQISINHSSDSPQAIPHGNSPLSSPPIASTNRVQKPSRRKQNGINPSGVVRALKSEENGSLDSDGSPLGQPEPGSGVGEYTGIETADHLYQFASTVPSPSSDNFLVARSLLSGPTSLISDDTPRSFASSYTSNSSLFGEGVPSGVPGTEVESGWSTQAPDTYPSRESQTIVALQESPWSSGKCCQRMPHVDGGTPAKTLPFSESFPQQHQQAQAEVSPDELALLRSTDDSGQLRRQQVLDFGQQENQPQLNPNPKQSALELSKLDHQLGETTVYNVPLSFGTAGQPLIPAQYKFIQQHPRLFEQRVPQHAPSGILAQAASATGSLNSFVAHNCSCGDACNCLGCAAHPYNHTSVNFAKSMSGFMLDDGQRDISSGDNNSAHGSAAPNCCASVSDVNHTQPPPSYADDHVQRASLTQSARNGFDPSLESDSSRQMESHSASFTPSSDPWTTWSDSHQHDDEDERTLSPSDYYYVEYPLISGCSMGTENCQCGDGCTCYGCLTHDGHNGIPLDQLPSSLLQAPLFPNASPQSEDLSQSRHLVGE